LPATQIAIRRLARAATGLLAVIAAPGIVAAQAAPGARVPADSSAVLSLSDAMREADRLGFANRMAVATADADRARARMPLKGILPSARVEAGLVRTTDPIGAFGTTLRQRLVTPAAFDPARLNNPPAVTNALGGLVLEVPLLNADAYVGLRAARSASNASQSAAEWTAITMRANVVRAYYGAVLAAEKMTMLEQARRAADAAMRQVQSMLQQGLVTKADVLQADVRATEVASQLIGARNEALTAKQQLGMLLGRTDGSLPMLPAALPSDSVVRVYAERDMSGAFSSADAGSRADVRAAHAGAIAANSDRLRANAALLPRVNSFARYDWNAPSGPFAGRKNWTVGLMATWSLFGGGSELADIAVATARAAGAKAGEQAALAQGAVEADATRRGVVVALERLDLAARAATQSLEAHRLVEKRYAGGLATIAELLGAESSATGAALARSAARFTLLDAIATHRRAIGADPADLASLDTAR